MIDQMANINLTYLAELLKNSDHAAEQYEKVKEFLVENLCTFGDKPVPTFLKPHFISPEQTRTLKYVVEKISNVLNKFIKLYLQDGQVRQILKFSDEENELFFIEPCYSTPLVIARLDAFMEDYTIKFLEFNCDSPAGTSYSESLEMAFKELSKNFPFLHAWKIEYTERHQNLLNALITCYDEFRTQKPSLPSHPTIAVVDWDDVSTASEFVSVKNFFESKGYNTIITSPLNFKIDGDRLLADGEQIHLIYKRVITRELLEKRNQVEIFFQGIKDGLACTCNPFRSYIVGNKKILALLKDPRFQHIYDGDELEVIKRTIPWTKILARGKVTYEGFTVNLQGFVSDNREKLVLKPASSYGGKDVFLGNETAQETWEKVIEENIESETWVVQEYVTIPQEIFPVIGDTLSLQLKNVNINPFALLGKYAGTISRVSDSSIINVSQGGGMVSSLSVERKEEIRYRT